jgi:hypothetical protein
MYIRIRAGCKNKEHLQEIGICMIKPGGVKEDEKFLQQ